MADASTLAAILRKKIAAQIADNHNAMDGGLAADQYMKMVGRQAQLYQLSNWITDGMKTVQEEEDDN